MSRLAARSTGRLEIVLMLFFGQSITQQNWWREVAADFWASFTAAGLRLISFPPTSRAKRCTRQPPPAILPLPRSSCRRLPSKNFSRAFATENLSSTSLGCGLARRDACRLPVAPASITGFKGAGSSKEKFVSRSGRVVLKSDALVELAAPPHGCRPGVGSLRVYQHDLKEN